MAAQLWWPPGGSQTSLGLAQGIITSDVMSRISSVTNYFICDISPRFGAKGTLW